MSDNALTWMMNDPYCIIAMAVVAISGCIALAVDCWRKWHYKCGEVNMRNVLPNRKAYKKARWKRMAYRFDSTVNESKARRWKIMRLM